MDIKIYFDLVHDDGKKRYLGQDEEANLLVEEKDSEIFKHLKSFKEAPSHQSLIYIFHHLTYSCRASKQRETLEKRILFLI